VLRKRHSADGGGDIDVMFSMYYNAAPAMSERLAALEKLRQEKDAKAEGLMSLARDEKK
jgi:hypothetical protein